MNWKLRTYLHYIFRMHLLKFIIQLIPIVQVVTCFIVNPFNCVRVFNNQIYDLEVKKYNLFKPQMYR